MRKPNLIIPGFPKSGTSTLHSALVQDNEIFDGGVKEPHTYTWDNHFKNRLSFFKEKYQDSAAKYILDSSTSYMVSKYAVDRILKDTPEAKFIIIARDPIDRIVSHYNWLSSLNLINKKPIDEISDHLNEKYYYRKHYHRIYKFYSDFSLYGEQLDYLLKRTNKENVLFMTFENFFSDFEAYRGVLEKFLNIKLNEITLNKINETSFSQKNKKKKARLEKRIITRLKYEYTIFKGAPRALKINKPKKYKTSREEIESIVLPHLKDDILKLASLGYNLNCWPSYTKLKKIE